MYMFQWQLGWDWHDNLRFFFECTKKEGVLEKQRKLDSVRLNPLTKVLAERVPPPLRTSQTDAAPNLITSPEILTRSSYPIGILLATLEPADKNPRERTHIQSR